ncbi:CDK5RAP3-like protein [Plasmodiophora brassicae]
MCQSENATGPQRTEPRQCAICGIWRERRMEAIDIPYDKVCQWLVDRNQIPKDWAVRVAALRARIAAELESLPATSAELQEISQLDFVGFRECERIVKALIAIETEKGVPVFTLFGQYKSAEIRKWNSIANQYRKSSLFLAEYGQRVVQIVKYDTQALKSEMASLAKNVEDGKRHAFERDRNAAQARAKYLERAKQLDIDPDLPARQQLLAQTSRLQDLFGAILAECKKPIFQQCIDSYDQFFAFCRGEKPVEHATIVSLKQFVALKSAILPSEATLLSLISDPGAGVAEASEIVELQWDGAVESVSVDQVPDPDEAPHEIEWDITTEDAATAQTEAGAEEETGSSLLQASFRSAVKIDLLEVEHFLKHRCEELETQSSFLDTFEGSSEAVSRFGRDATWTRETLSHVQHVLSMFDDDLLQRLLRTRVSPSYVDRLVASVESQLTLESKCLQKAAAMRQKATELGEQMGDLSRQLKSKTSEAVWLKESIESELAQLFKGKSIKLIGEIGNVVRSALQRK